MRRVGRVRGILVLLACVFLGGSPPHSWAATRPADRAASTKDESVVVGSKHFNESYLLAEILAQLLEDRGIHVERIFGLGGTLICFEALKKGEIDVYPEYSGTVEQAILKLPRREPYQALQHRLQGELNMDLLDPFGFNNTYAMALNRRVAEQHDLVRISDLAKVPALRFGFSHEFLKRKDGWPGLAKAYGLSAQPLGIEHGLAYQAIREGQLDVTDVYSTDGDIKTFDLVLLEDDKEFFPRYLAAPLVRGALHEATKSILNELAGMITDSQMQALNAKVVLEKRTFADVAHEFLQDAQLLRERGGRRAAGFWTTLLRRVATHLKLTLIALLAAMAIAFPCGLLVYRIRAISKPVIYLAGSLQTIPSIALLAFMIPVFGIGAIPAIVALFLYALLPILRNTAIALFSIDPALKKVGAGMGLTPGQRLRYIEIPLAAPTILAGIKTAAVVNIGTATLAAFIGAGGLGEPIVTGLALNDTALILEGAIPAALLAILTELFFDMLERVIIPRHLLQQVVE